MCCRLIGSCRTCVQGLAKEAHVECDPTPPLNDPRCRSFAGLQWLSAAVGRAAGHPLASPHVADNLSHLGHLN